jgi:hypothetical protein
MVWLVSHSAMITSKCLVIVGPKTISLTRQKAIIGKVCVQLDELSFPDEEWSDFFVILAHWMSSLAKGQDSKSTRIALNFMDGPYELVAQSLSGGEWELLARDRVSGREEKRIRLRSITEIIEPIYNAAKEVVVVCERQGVSSPDLDEIKWAMRLLPDFGKPR